MVAITALAPPYDISFADARALAADIRKKVPGGVDPVRERALVQERPPTFAQVTRECYEASKGGWKKDGD